MLNAEQIVTAIQRIRNVIIRRAAEGAAYPSWTDNFARKEIRQVWLNVIPEAAFIVTIADLKKLSRDNLLMLDFAIWEGNHFLIPLYLVNFIQRGEMILTISGKTVEIDGFDLDNRAGCIAGGFRID